MTYQLPGSEGDPETHVVLTSIQSILWVWLVRASSAGIYSGDYAEGKCCWGNAGLNLVKITVLVYCRLYSQVIPIST